MKNIIAVIFCLPIIWLEAQTYSNNREKFVKEFQKSLTEFGKGDYQDFAKKDLPMILLETSDFPQEYFEKMVETCNLMQTKNLSPYPETYEYVFSVYSLIKGKQSATSYNAWQSSVVKLLDNKNIKKFTDFIELSAGFFSEQRIATSSNFNWYYEGGTYLFEFTDKPSIKFSGGSLMCKVQNRGAKDKNDNPFLDSLVIYQTQGTYDPILKKWQGTGGKVTWEKVGIPKNETFATFQKYDVSCKASTLTVDSVLLTTKYFTKPIAGSLSDRAFTINRKEDRVYPQFISFEKRLRIKNVRENVDYDGGFSMQGSSFIGIGSAKEPARVYVYRNNTVFIKASAQLIDISPEKIFCNNTAACIYLNNQDSIYHPGVSFVYNYDKKMIEFSRTSQGNGQAPFSDSYHDLDIYVSKLSWKTDESDIFFTFDFGTSQEKRYASFESKNYFNEQLFDRLQGLETVHPLVTLSNYCYKYDEYVLTEGKAASAFSKTIEQVKPLLIELSNNGFINYDLEAKMITVNPKLDNFVKGKSGTKDYDNLVFVSDLRQKELKGYTADQVKEDSYLQKVQAEYKRKSDERNLMTYFGKLNLTSMYIDLHAVDQITVSNLKNTVIFPDDSRVSIKENRNFDFSGWLNAGKLETHALAASFNYSTNKISLLKTNESILRVRPLQEADGKRSIAMNSSIKNIKGEILIDDPGNRAGLNKKFGDYPKLIVNDPSKVYYNSKDIYRGAYDSSRFYYTIIPFTLDSLHAFNEKALRFKGELTSAGIFPKIAEDLKIMPDYSFGFSTQAPATGHDFYGTGAKYQNKIVLSNNGLQGAGTINFIESTSISKALTFLPDSTIGLAQFTNRAVETGVQFPDVTSEEAFITYYPKKNMLKAASTPKSDLVFFNKEAKLRGTAIVTAKGMEGKGLMTFKNATTVSNKYTYKRWDIFSDTTGFNLKNSFAEEGEDQNALIAKNWKAEISFKERRGDFISNEGSSEINFPANQYKCLMDKFLWFMDYAELQMERTGGKELASDADMDLVGPNFFSTHPKQDSLQFQAQKAKYDLKQRTIFCEKAEYIEVADARIYPDSMKVVIRKNAKMDPLRNAKIVANFVTKYHTFVKAEVDIQARRAYKAAGEYPFYDKDSNLTYVVMKNITLDTSYRTIASGQISDQQGFKLSKQFDYYGTVAVTASEPFLTFTGATRINHSCEKFDKTWMSFTAPIDPKNIQIPVAAQMKNLDGQSISAGIVWRNSSNLDSLELYPTFLSKLYLPGDPIVLTAYGFLQYNEAAKEFQIGSKDKLLNRAEKGNFLALHTESCSMNGEGVVDLGMNYGDLKIDAVGVVSYNQSTGKTEMNLTTRFDMAMDKGMMEDVATRINAVEGLKPLELNKTTFEQALLEWTDQKTADKIKSDYALKGEIKKLPSALEKTMILTGVKLVSFDNTSNEEKGLISSVESAVLVNMYEKPILKYVPLRAFFQQVYSEAGGDKFGIQIDIPGGRDYYFDYSMVKKDGEMRIITGDMDMSNAIMGIKEEKKKTKNFKFDVSTQRVYLSKFLGLFGL